MQALRLPSNIMSLAGIAIAIGTMVDMGIVMLENIYQHLTDHRDDYTRVETDAHRRQREIIDHGRRSQLVRDAATEVGSAILTAISTTVVSFVPVFFLEGQAAKLFTPLAWTKNILHGRCRHTRVDGGPAAGLGAAQESAHEPGALARRCSDDRRRTRHNLDHRRSNPLAVVRAHALR